MDILHLLWGTVLHRPYVYGFFLCYLIFSLYQLGSKRTGLYLIFAYLIALVSELCSTRWSFPFGMYVYIDTTRTEELWISNVPFWDSLSFVFLSYFSWMLAGALRSQSFRAGPRGFAARMADIHSGWRTDDASRHRD